MTSLPATSPVDLEKALSVLTLNKNRWVRLDTPTRIRLLRASLKETHKDAEAFVREACRFKGIDFNSPVSAEEWLAGPMPILRNLRLLIEVLENIQSTGQTGITEKDIIGKGHGFEKVRVFPRNLLDKLLYADFSAEIWTRKLKFQQLPTQGKLALVLGAGNVASIGCMDVLYKLFAENQICILKMNPVNETLGPHLEICLKPFIAEGFVKIVYGGAQVGEFLVNHSKVEEIHITGSDRIHDVIVWGAPGTEQETNKKNKTPKTKKRVTSELGCVTPVIVVPGTWTEKELQFQAENVATMVANNASFNCNAAKVIVTSQDWPQRTTFLYRVEEVLSKIPTRQAYYPGSDKKYQQFLTAHPDAKPLAPETPEHIPWTTIFGVDSTKTNDIAFTTEAWCGILSETPLPAKDTRDYLKKAVEFCNTHLWGTLSASLIVDPRTQKEFATDVEQALADLKYGSIGLNHWPALSFGLVNTAWGAAPGHTLDNIVSGIGLVHNIFMIDNPQKSIIRGPFTMTPKPPWFTTHKNAHRVARKLTNFEYHPSFSKLPGILLAAMKG